MFNQRICLGYLRQSVSSAKGRLAYTTYEAPPQYDVSEKMRKLFELKTKQREATKAYYQKIIMNPHRPKLDEVPFDPVLFRYNALMTYHAEYYKPNMKNTAFFFGMYIIPIILLHWFLTYTRGKREKKYRAGEIPYEQRQRTAL